MVMREGADHQSAKALARGVGLSLLALIMIAIASAAFVTDGVNINLSADVAAVAEAMLNAEQRLRAKAYVAALTFSFEAFVAIGLFVLLRGHGLVLAAWCLALSLASALLVLLGGVFAMNAAEIGANTAYETLDDGAARLTLVSLQATSDYTSFHLGLVIGSVAKAGFFRLFLRSGLIPMLIAGWGVFASLFVVSAIVARDFVPAVGNDAVTMAFLASNLVAIVSLALYLAIRGVRRR
ncbi:MAG: DUF4386 domain-containing protein [Caulobacterales bacterium]|nr:DUF4386 domain-containing protein [Caulobacterales bacterium]